MDDAPMPPGGLPGRNLGRAILFSKETTSKRELLLDRDL